MFETLDSLDWQELRHAYGPASDTPDLLRDVTSDDLGRRSFAENRLRETIWHQGTVYEATVTAIPFIFEIVVAGDERAKVWAIIYLASLAVGVPEEYLPYNFDLKEYLKGLREQARSVKSRTRAVGPDIQLAVYSGIEDRLDPIIDQLEIDNVRIQGACAYTLAWFPKVDRALSRFESALQKCPADEMSACNLLLGYGLFTYHRNERMDEGIVQRFIRSESAAVRTSAAIAAAHRFREPLISETLISAARNESLRDLFPKVLFNEGDISGYAEMVLNARMG